MAREYDREFYKDVGGQKVLDYIVRPNIRNNNLGPLPVGSNIKVRILKNGELVVSFFYDIQLPPANGRVLFASAMFDVREAPDSAMLNPMGEEIICQDVPIYEKRGEEFVVDHIERPRNVRRDNLGGWKDGDECRVEFLVNDTVMDSFDYYPTAALPEGFFLAGTGSIDFVEVVG